jgi:hypothetical protein
LENGKGVRRMPDVVALLLIYGVDRRRPGGRG